MTFRITLLALAKRNLNRRPFRTIALILAVAVVTATLFTAARGALFATLMSEAGMVSSIGGIAGVTAGGLFLYGVRNMIMSSLSLPYLWPSQAFTFLMALLCFIVAFVTGLLAAFYPVYRSSVLEPYKAIRQG